MEKEVDIRQGFFWDVCVPCGNTHCDLQSLRKLKVMLLLILPNHKESDIHADAKDSNFTLLAKKKRDQPSNKNKHTDSSVRAIAV